MKQKGGAKIGNSGLKTPLMGTVAYDVRKSMAIPGPGAYSPCDPGSKINGGTWGRHKVMSYLDHAVKRAQGMPGANQYDTSGAYKVSGGKFNMSKPKGSLELVTYAAKGLPGPGQYGAPALPKPSGGKFNMSNAKSDVEWKIYKAKSLPAPGQYGAPALPKPSGGKFNLGVSKSEVEWRVYRAKSIPAPNQYEVCGFGKLTGGKFNQAVSKTSTEWEMYRAAQIPGPGRYNPEDAFDRDVVSRPRKISDDPDWCGDEESTARPTQRPMSAFRRYTPDELRSAATEFKTRVHGVVLDKSKVRPQKPRPF